MKRLQNTIVAGAIAIAAMSANPAAAVTLLVKYQPVTDANGAFSFNVESDPVPTETSSTRFDTDITNGTGQYFGLTSVRFRVAERGGLLGNYEGAQIFSGTTEAPSIFRSGSFFATLRDDPTQTGTLTISAVGAVPEPATWALMLLGFGAVGFVLRRRRQTTTVSFQTA